MERRKASKPTKKGQSFDYSCYYQGYFVKPGQEPQQQQQQQQQQPGRQDRSPTPPPGPSGLQTGGDFHPRSGGGDKPPKAGREPRPPPTFWDHWNRRGDLRPVKKARQPAAPAKKAFQSIFGDLKHWSAELYSGELSDEEGQKEEVAREVKSNKTGETMADKDNHWSQWAQQAGSSSAAGFPGHQSQYDDLYQTQGGNPPNSNQQPAPTGAYFSSGGQQSYGGGSSAAASSASSRPQPVPPPMAMQPQPGFVAPPSSFMGMGMGGGGGGGGTMSEEELAKMRMNLQAMKETVARNEAMLEAMAQTQQRPEPPPPPSSSGGSGGGMRMLTGKVRSPFPPLNQKKKKRNPFAKNKGDDETKDPWSLSEDSFKDGDRTTAEQRSNRSRSPPKSRRRSRTPESKRRRSRSRTPEKQRRRRSRSPSSGRKSDDKGKSRSQLETDLSGSAGFSSSFSLSGGGGMKALPSSTIVPVGSYSANTSFEQWDGVPKVVGSDHQQTSSQWSYAGAVREPPTIYPPQAAPPYAPPPPPPPRPLPPAAPSYTAPPPPPLMPPLSQRPPREQQYFDPPPRPSYDEGEFYRRNRSPPPPMYLRRSYDEEQYQQRGRSPPPPPMYSRPSYGEEMYQRRSRSSYSPPPPPSYGGDRGASPPPRGGDDPDVVLEEMRRLEEREAELRRREKELDQRRSFISVSSGGGSDSGGGEWRGGSGERRDDGRRVVAYDGNSRSRSPPALLSASSQEYEEARRRYQEEFKEREFKPLKQQPKPFFPSSGSGSVKDRLAPPPPREIGAPRRMDLKGFSRISTRFFRHVLLDDDGKIHPTVVKDLLLDLEKSLAKAAEGEVIYVLIDADLAREPVSALVTDLEAKFGAGSAVGLIDARDKGKNPQSALRYGCKVPFTLRTSPELPETVKVVVTNDFFIPWKAVVRHVFCLGVPRPHPPHEQDVKKTQKILFKTAIFRLNSLLDELVSNSGESRRKSIWLRLWLTSEDLAPGRMLQQMITTKFFSNSISMRFNGDPKFLQCLTDKTFALDEEDEAVQKKARIRFRLHSTAARAQNHLFMGNRLVATLREELGLVPAQKKASEKKDKSAPKEDGNGCAAETEELPDSGEAEKDIEDNNAEHSEAVEDKKAEEEEAIRIEEVEDVLEEADDEEEEVMSLAASEGALKEAEEDEEVAKEAKGKQDNGADSLFLVVVASGHQHVFEAVQRKLEGIKSKAMLLLVLKHATKTLPEAGEKKADGTGAALAPAAKAAEAEVATAAEAGDIPVNTVKRWTLDQEPIHKVESNVRVVLMNGYDIFAAITSLLQQLRAKFLVIFRPASAFLQVP